MKADSMGPIVLLVRHGRTALNAAGQLRGHLDPPLDAVGATEVAALAQELSSRSVQAVVTSPLRRARQTGQAIADAADAPLSIDDRLIDRDYGAWAGRPKAELLQRFGSLDAAPGVEPAASVRGRALAVLADTLDADAFPVVLVAHDAVNTALLAALSPSLTRDPSFAQATACWNLLRWQADSHRWAVEQVNRRPGPS